MPPSDRGNTLTPLRKHRKLLKDGSGSEVWPESLEQIFVQGLRAYWESPYASHSRGRSRWRNQFLVEYLHNVGVTRSKKQVASHIQVLRNMWKGQPEYQLVAGGDEQTTDQNGDVVKVEEQYDPDALIRFDGTEESDTSSSPSYSPMNFPNDVPPSPFKTESPSTLLAFPSQTLQSSPSSPIAELGGYSPLSFNSDATPLPFEPSVQQHHQNAYYTSSPVTGRYPSQTRSSSIGVPSSTSFNRVTNVGYYANGMAPLGIKTDALFPLSTPRARTTPIALKIRLTMPSYNDARAPLGLQGFVCNLCLSAVWNSHAKCVTRVYTGGVCVSEESSALEVSKIDMGTVIVVLPESSLSRCRYLDAAATTSLMQEIIVDNETVAYFIYELNRRSTNGMPLAELVGSQLYPAPQRTTQTQNPQSASERTATPAGTHQSSPSSRFPQYTRPTDHSSLSYALTPSGYPRNTWNASLTL